MSSVSPLTVAGAAPELPGGSLRSLPASPASLFSSLMEANRTAPPIPAPERSDLSCYRRRLELQRHAEAGLVILEAQRRMVQPGDGGHEAQSQAVAGRTAAGVQAHESLEDASLVGFGDARAAVGDTHRCADAVDGRRERQGNAAAAGAIFGGIVDQVAKGLEQELAIAGDDSGPSDPAFKFQAVVLHQRAIELRHVVGQRLQIHGNEVAAASTR